MQPFVEKYSGLDPNEKGRLKEWVQKLLAAKPPVEVEALAWIKFHIHGESDSFASVSRFALAKAFEAWDQGEEYISRIGHNA